MSKATLILISLLVFVFLVIVGNLFLLSLGITGKVIDEKEFDYQHTKAICEGNTCRDFAVKCKDGKAIQVTPISGFVTFDETWKDSREDKELCK